MSLAVVRSRALDGLAAPEVRVEVHLANGLPSFTLVGLADTEVKEARERVRAALAHSGLGFPANQRITVNLAPADLPKESGRFDLPIAIGILAAAGHLDMALLDRHELAGELSLGGDLRPVRGAVAIALALRRDGVQRRLLLPPGSAEQAALVPECDVRVAAHLLDVVGALQLVEPRELPRARASDADGSATSGPDLRDVRGQAGAKRALEIAAAGRHSLLLCGPPGSGKSMLAQRLAGLLGPMSDDEALASAAVHSLNAAGFDMAGWGRRPVRAPHHTASAVALVGGGSPPRPGEISLAHGGVLFLDELPEFPRAALESLREPLENGCITISRAARRATFPADFQLVAAMNPCPCGWLGAAPSSAHSCRCTPDAVARYRARLSGPLLDRIDLRIDVPAVRPSALLGLPEGEPSAVVAARVAGARARALARQGSPNAVLDAATLGDVVPREAAADRLLQQAADRLGLTGRGLHRVLRVALTIGDLQAAGVGGAAPATMTMTAAHVAEALQYRSLS